MAPPTDDQIALIKRFEPILYCAPGERFFPSDVKRYVEHCSLWRAMDPAGQFATASTWGAGPAIPAGKIVVTESEAADDDVFLGKKDSSGFMYLTSTAQQESFLSLFGWRPPDAVLTNSSYYANIEAIANAYEQTASLNNSQFWYHAEFFATARLNELFSAVLASGGHDFTDLLKPHGLMPAILKNPALICYYLFFPAHEEPLDGCSRPDAQHFGDYAGDWGCVAVLIDQATTGDPFQPVYIGLTNRNIGMVKQPDGSEVRVGMRVLPWSSVPTSDAPGHPSLAVAKGTHALYLRGETPAPVKPFTPVDLARASCGAAEDTPGAVGPYDDSPRDYEAEYGLVLAKMIAGASAGFVFGLTAIGLIAGLVWGVAEVSKPFGLAPPLPSPSPTVDKVASADSAGRVIHPADVTLPNVTPANAVAWPTDGAAIDQRRYDLYVDREATVLWADDPQADGYGGRWGPRVEHDSFLRRSGMLFPNFWRMFFDALVIMDVPGGTAPQPPTPTQTAIPRTDGIPIGNATMRGGLAAAYDGNPNKAWADSPTNFDPAGVWIGKHFPQSHLFTGITIQLSSDLGVVGNTGGVRTCTIYGKSDIDPATPTDGTVLFRIPVVAQNAQAGVPDQAGLKLEFLTGFDTTKTYDRVWVTLDNPDGDELAVFTQVVWWATDT